VSIRHFSDGRLEFVLYCTVLHPCGWKIWDLSSGFGALGIGIRWVWGWLGWLWGFAVGGVGVGVGMWYWRGMGTAGEAVRFFLLYCSVALSLLFCICLEFSFLVVC
jgi:hypothetical protein